ncbi:MAG: pilus assembly protein TadG-related protein [Gemmataceae bacterium]
MRTPIQLRRRGSIAPLMAVAMIPILGFAAIAIDGGLQLDHKRRTQAAADAAALAAAVDLFRNYDTRHGLDPTGAAATSAKTTAAADGYTHNGTTTTVTVSIPPISGPFTGKSDYAEVTILYKLSRGFSSIWGTDTLPIYSRAVARGSWKNVDVGVLLLDPSSSSALKATGNGSVTVLGAPIVVDSVAADGAVSSGGGTLVAPEFDFAGTPGYSGSGFTGTIHSTSSPTSDPLINLPPPDINSLTVQDTNGKHISGNGHYTLDPGVYYGGIDISSGANVTLNPGIYYMKNGGFKYSGNASSSLSGSGVFIYSDPSSNSDDISITGQGTVNLSPPTSGTYAGVTLYQNRNASNSVKISGGGMMTITGTFYAAGAQLQVSGSSGNNTIGSQYISYQLSLSGSGNVTIDWYAASARVRTFGLVE